MPRPLFWQKQPVSAYDSDHLIGVFYIESSSRKSVSVYDISCIDALGVMDSEPFAAAIYSGASAKTLIQTILAGHFTLEYDSSLDDAKVTGYIPDCTKREALQQMGATQLAAALGELLAAMDDGRREAAQALLALRARLRVFERLLTQRAVVAEWAAAADAAS